MLCCFFGREGLLARPHALDWSSAGVSLTSGVPTGLAEGILLSKTYVSVSWFRMLIAGGRGVTNPTISMLKPKPRPRCGCCRFLRLRVEDRNTKNASTLDPPPGLFFCKGFRSSWVVLEVAHVPRRRWQNLLCLSLGA